MMKIDYYRKMDGENPLQIINNYLNELEQLRLKALTSRNSLVVTYGYDILRDYRITIFEQIDRVLIYHDTNVVMFLRYIMHPEYVTELFNTSEKDSKRIAIDYLQRSKHALIIFFQSVVESYYRALGKAINLKDTHQLSKLVNSIFNHYNIEHNCEWKKANEILSIVRNTLHNNGIHTHPDIKIDYHGKTHLFSKGLAHHSGGYDTIIHIMSDIIEFIFSIGCRSSHIPIIDNNDSTDYF